RAVAAQRVLRRQRPVRRLRRPGAHRGQGTRDLHQLLRLGHLPFGEPAPGRARAEGDVRYRELDDAVRRAGRRVGPLDGGQRLHDSATFNEMMQRAQNWQNLYNPATAYLQPRNTDGSFNAGFNPASSSGFVEGNGAQYVWMVPYDEAGLFTALGGNAAVNSR